jgi:uncharacterized protein DUF5946
MCDECGAPGSECEARFNEFLALEFTDPNYGSVHHLTVSAYMLQHSSKLTKEAWLYERGLLREFVDGKAPARVRMDRKDAVDSSKRTFRIKSRDGKPVIPHMDWSKTILDVRSETAVLYCQHISAWARAVLADCERIHTGR